MNKTATNIHVQGFMGTDDFIPSGRIAGSEGTWIFNSIRNC